MTLARAESGVTVLLGWGEEKLGREGVEKASLEFFGEG